tara:strand:+ start:331 stop:483 length:153 start_codon:yes stop_codon:yes gene_type:complete
MVLITYTKALLLLPAFAFCFTFLKENTDESVIDLFSFVAEGGYPFLEVFF